MDKIIEMNKLLVSYLRSRLWYAIAIFVPVIFSLALAFYVISPVYMLLDFFTKEIYSILKPSSENESSGTGFVKHLLGFAYVMSTHLAVASIGLVLAILHFLTAIFCFVTSLGNCKCNPFVYHELLK